MVTINSFDSNIPIELSKGGTNATSFSTNTGVVKYDGTRLVTSTTALIDSSNRATNTSQPAFSAYLGTKDDNVTGDGTVFYLGSGNALTELFDQGANFNVNGIFTAPVTGIYFFVGRITISGVTQNHTWSDIWFEGSSPAGNYFEVSLNPYACLASDGNLTIGGSGLIQLDAAATLKMGLYVSNGTKVVDVNPKSGSSYPTIFSGYLVC